MKAYYLSVSGFNIIQRRGHYIQKAYKDYKMVTKKITKLTASKNGKERSYNIKIKSENCSVTENKNNNFQTF